MNELLNRFYNVYKNDRFVTETYYKKGQDGCLENCIDFGVPFSDNMGDSIGLYISQPSNMKHHIKVSDDGYTLFNLVESQTAKAMKDPESFAYSRIKLYNVKYEKPTDSFYILVPAKDLKLNKYHQAWASADISDFVTFMEEMYLLNDLFSSKYSKRMSKFKKFIDKNK